MYEERRRVTAMPAIKITQVELNAGFKIPDLGGRLEGGTNKNQTCALSF